MSIFKNLGKTLKKAAPLIGAGIGFYFGGPMGAGLGSGIGTLAGGGSAEDALLAGALGYAGGSMAQGYLPQYGQAATMGPFASGAAGTASIGSQTAGSPAIFDTAAGMDPGLVAEKGFINTTAAGGTAGGSTSILGGIGNFMKENPLLSTGLGIGALGLLAGGGEEEEGEASPFPETREGRAYQTKVKGPITGTTYNLANKDEREQYNNELLQLREKSFKYKDGGDVYTGNGNVPETYPNKPGGELKGPGTGTSDSIRVGVYDSQGNYQGPGALSDGEFILTAKAVRGAGNGDRDIGAARMYDMMAELESMA